MSDSIFGTTRTKVRANHAVICPDGHVVSPIFGWREARGVVLISPAMGRGPGAPRFVQYLIYGNEDCWTDGAAEGVERLVYVLHGNAVIDGAAVGADSFAWMPPGDRRRVEVLPGGQLLVFEKTYEPLPGVPTPPPTQGVLREAHSEPFFGDPNAMLSTLLPVAPGFDMAVNVFEFRPGTTLPFVETHVMEHGLYMRSGQGVYRLDDEWLPVCKGDAIWMGSYCPQWFVAMGKGNASYIYYKDIHRDPLRVAR